MTNKPQTTEISTEALIWANRFINIGLGRNGTKLCTDAQARCMQAVIDEAYAKGRRDGEAYASP